MDRVRKLIRLTLEKVDQVGVWHLGHHEVRQLILSHAGEVPAHPGNLAHVLNVVRVPRILTLFLLVVVAEEWQIVVRVGFEVHDERLVRATCPVRHDHGLLTKDAIVAIPKAAFAVPLLQVWYVLL